MRRKEVCRRLVGRASILRLAGFVLLTTILGLGQAEMDPWLIVPNGDAGPINARVARADLVRRYGAANVVDQEVGAGEGDTDTATVVFPKDPERRIEILWQDHDKKASPSSVSISGKASCWHAVHGISLGMSFRELEHLNGRPFSISWGTDQGNVVLSWKGGLLDEDLKNRGIVFVWFDDAPSSSRHSPTRENRQRRVDRMAW